MSAIVSVLSVTAVAAVALVCGGCTARVPAGSGPTEHLPAQGALGPYSAAVCVGELVLLSGKIGERGGSFEREVETAIDAVEAELRRLGLGVADVVSVTVHLTDMATYAELNAVYARRCPQPWPARTTVAVAALPGGARVELSATARRR
jgi:2-iminobutanoate/2-iminopropanoate deaminase